jgi:hypothetical protein
MIDIWLQIVLILALIGVESYFVASEIALISARRALLRQRAEGGSRGAATAVKLMEDPTRLLTIQMGSVIGFLRPPPVRSPAQPLGRGSGRSACRCGARGAGARRCCVTLVIIT